MNIMGLDTGYVNNGYCIYDTNNKRIIEKGDITTTEKIFENKLLSIYDKFYELFEKYNIEILVYEKPIFNGRGENGALLNQAVGIMRLIARKHNAEIKSYTATQVKNKVTGNGKAGKDTVAKYVSEIFNIPNNFSSDHVSDSVAVLACYLKDKNII